MQEGRQPQARWWERKREKLLELAKDNTPMYVYDEETIKSFLSTLKSFTAVSRVFYALKANPHPDVMRKVYEAGFGFECVSPGEIKHVLNLFPDLMLKEGEESSRYIKSRILFTPNFASKEEYLFGFQMGAIVTLDSLHPIERWSEIFEGREIMLRMDPPTSRKGHHEHVKTTGKESKFGISMKEMERIPELIAKANAKVVGLHAHVGSGIFNPETWAETAEFLSSFLNKLPDAKVLDLGGGLGIVEKEGQPSLDVALVGSLLEKFKEKHPDVQLWMEPGRYIISEAGVLLATVTQIKKKSEVNYVGVNTGFNSLIRPMLYAAHHHIVNLSRYGDKSSTIVADIVGNICESGDVFGHERELPGETDEGDVILIATAGAYGHSMASNYNLREPAKEVFLIAN